MKKLYPLHQTGASLIEVLVAVLILSFGMLSLGGMMAYGVQLPKLAAYRADAATLAASHVERMRANPVGFDGGSYNVTMFYPGALPIVVPCVYPNCVADSLAALDTNETNKALRSALPSGGMRVVCNGACTNRSGDIWVLWREPTTFASLNTASADECPDPAVAPTFTAFTTQPRCLHIKFQL